ncbi:MAG: glucokinase [Tahibacter sp.]
MHEITLLADVGGTNVRFALADTSERMPLLSDSIRRYRVADFVDFPTVAKRYLDEIGARPQSGVFAFAGPVDGDSVQITNHPWKVVLSQTQTALGLDRLRAINDFSAMSLAVTLLNVQDLVGIGSAPLPLMGGRPRQTFALVGPGTGLGVGALLVRNGVVDTLDSEGGHLSFAPRNQREIEILHRLQMRFDRISNERLLCGSGLVNLHRALCEIDGIPSEELTPKNITERASAESDGSCARAVELFCALLGAAAGDLVLAFGAWDGVFITGGLTPHVLPWLQRGDFRRRFEDKGRFAARLADVPTLAVLHEDAGLLGASAQAVLDSGKSVLHRTG